jgi:predicted acylesterase/phospholipase RssA/CRP-like cAMP-binding protein
MSTDLVSHIVSHSLFKELDEGTLAGLERELDRVRLARGEVLLCQGDPGEALYILIRGRLGVKIGNPDGTDTEVDELEPGVSVGDMELLTGRACVATVYALEDAELVRFSRSGFERLTEEQPQAVAEFAQTLRPRFQRAQLAGILSALLGELDVQAIHDLQSRLEWLHLRSGTILFDQGDAVVADDAMYIVVQGRLRFVARGPDGGPTMVGEASSGDSIGEFALVTGEARTATVYAVRDTDVVRISRPLFEHLLAHYPQMMRRIAQVIIRREQRLTRAPSGESTTALALVLVPAGPDVPLAAFGRRLADTLAAFGPTLYLDAEGFDRAYGKAGMSQTAEDHPANLVLMAWLGEREREFQYILYEADRTWSPWAQRCLRQADTVLLVGRAGGDPTPGVVERARTDTRACASPRTELVLLHPDHTVRPAGTREWLQCHTVSAHHHVRLGVAQDVERLVRRLTGRALGLVLSGGGARGFGHIGAIRALEEAGLQVDLVGGTSMGALVGGAYALGYDHEGMHDLAVRFGSPKALFDYTLPLVSFMKTGKVTRLLERIAQDAQIEDLWRPFFCVSCNLSRSEQVVHRAGPVWQCIRASLAIPGVFAPLLQDGNLLVDGGMINNLPIDVMRALCPGGTVIGVDVGAASTASPAQGKEEAYKFGPSVSGWRVLWSRVNPLIPRIRVPSILGSLMHATQVNSCSRLAATQHLADLVVSLPVESFGMLDFAAHEAIIERGYQATRQALEGWTPTHTPRL